MTLMLDRPAATLMPTGRYEWERLVRRISGMSDGVARLAFTLSSYADPDGTRIRPGEAMLAGDMDKSVRQVRRLLAELIDRYGLLQLVNRGGGRGGTGRAATYRLTLPTDLLDRVELRPIGADSPDIQMSSQSSNSPDIQVSGQSTPDPVDNPESPDTQMSGQSPVDNAIDRTYNTVTNGLTGHLAPIDRTPRCPPTTHIPTTKDQPTDSPPKATTDRAREPPNGKRPSGSKCDRHPVMAGGTDRRGRPRCPLCRQQPERKPP